MILIKFFTKIWKRENCVGSTYIHINLEEKKNENE